MFHRRRFLVFILFVFTLSACGGGGDGSGTSSAQQNPHLVASVANMGVVTSGEITAYEFINGENGAQIGNPVMTDEDGNFDLASLAGIHSGPALLVLRDPDGNALYFNEADAKMVPFPAGKELRAVVGNLDDRLVAITPLTEVAAIMAMSFVADQGLTDLQAVSRANNEVSHAFLGGINPLYTVPVDVRKNIASSSNNEAVYANVLAGIAFVAQRNSRDPIDQAAVYAANLLGNNTQLLQNDLGDLVQAIANFNQSPPANVFVPPISTDIAPVAYGQTVISDEDETASITLHGGDLNRLPVMFTIETQPQFGRLIGTPPSVSYQPNADYHGQDSFQFIVHNGFQPSSRAMVNILINPVADAPVASNSVLLTAENEQGTGTLRASDADGEQLTYSIVTNPVNGIVTSLNQDTGEFVYQPNQNVAGTDDFTFQVSDGMNSSNIATMDITVRNINNQPTATGQLITLDEDAQVDITLGGTDTDADPLVVVLTSAPVHGTLAGVIPNLTYVPANGFYGQDSFRFIVTDGALNSAEAVISLKVNPVNDSPQPINQTLSMSQGGNISFVLNGSDPEQDSLTYTITTMPGNGVLNGAMSGSVAGMSQLIYVPQIAFSGQDSLVFELNDGSGGIAVGTITIEVLPYAASSSDSDGDGLRDSDEAKLGTSPILVDTDGDGFSDYDEVVTYAFNKDVNNFRFNPLLADVPQIDIQLVTLPDFQLDYTTTDGSSSTFTSNRSDASATSFTRSDSEDETDVTSTFWEAGGSLEVTAKAEVGLTDAKVGLEVAAKVEFSGGGGTENSTTTSWEETSGSENSTTVDNGEAFESNNSIATSGGDVLVTAQVTNTGHLTYTLNDLFLGATYYDGIENQKVPVGNLSYMDGGFPGVTLAPGQTTGALNFKTGGLAMDAMKRLLKNSRGMTIAPSIYNLLDHNGQAFNFASTAMGSLDAQIIIDFVGNGGRSNIKKYIAVNGNPTQPLSVLEALNNILNVDVVMDGDVVVIDEVTTAFSRINAIDGLENTGSDGRGFWMMVHGQNQGNNKFVTTVYTTHADKNRWETKNPEVSNLVDNYDLAAITLNGGDILHLFYMQDSDLDGLSNVREFFYRSDPNNVDSDYDGLEDGDEVKGWQIAYTDRFGSKITRKVYSDPTLSDSDGDGLTDKIEANFDNSKVGSNVGLEEAEKTALDAALIDTGVSLSDSEYASKLAAQIKEAYQYFRRDPSMSDTDGDGLRDDDDDFEGLALGKGFYDDLEIYSFNSKLIIGTVDVPTVVNVGYTPPGIVLDDQNITGYSVALFRQESLNGVFSEPNRPPVDGRKVLNGDTLPCVNNAQCMWVSVANSNVLKAPAGEAVSDVTGEVTLTDSFPDGVLAAVKYIAYASINGVHRRMEQSTIASANSETIRIKMKPGLIRDKKNVVLPKKGFFGYNKYNYVWYNNARSYAYHPSEYPASGYKYKYHRIYLLDNSLGSTDLHMNTSLKYSTGYSKYVRFPPVMHPLNRGDGAIDLVWSIKVNGTSMHQSQSVYPEGQRVMGSYSGNTNKLGELDTMSGVDGSSLNLEEIFEAANSFSVDLPAEEGCHTILFTAGEYDSIHDQAFPPTVTSGVSQILCRDTFGDWTLSGSVDRTRKGNIYPISYGGALTWQDAVGRDTPIDFKLDFGYDIYVE